jgi:hypothetical protein
MQTIPFAFKLHNFKARPKTFWNLNINLNAFPSPHGRFAPCYIVDQESVGWGRLSFWWKAEGSKVK